MVLHCKEAGISTDMMDLARRAVACKHWRWMPGMAYTRRGYTYRVDPEILSTGGKYGDTCLPDLTDPATLGCLLALVREAYSFTLWLSLQRTNWTWFVDGISGVLAHGLSEAEALVAALEAAP